MVQHDDHSFECYSCHHVSYFAYSEDARAFDDLIERLTGRSPEPESPIDLPYLDSSAPITPHKSAS